MNALTQYQTIGSKKIRLTNGKLWSMIISNFTCSGPPDSGKGHSTRICEIVKGDDWGSTRGWMHREGAVGVSSREGRRQNISQEQPG